jgi:hypothetical protein
MFCLLYSPKTPKQKIVKFHTQKQIGKSHVIDIFTSEDMENISLCIFQYLTLYCIIKLHTVGIWMEFSVGRWGDRHLSLTPKTHCFTCVIQNVSEFVAVGKHSGFPKGKCCVVVCNNDLKARWEKNIWTNVDIFLCFSNNVPCIS